MVAGRIQKPLATLKVLSVGHTSIIVRRHGNPSGPRLLLSHGNGLAIDMYYPFWSLLCGQFDVIVYDIRNHGWNPVTEQSLHNVDVFVRDSERVVAKVDQHFGPKPLIGVFHSLSALVALIHEARRGAFSALFLLDPPLSKPGMSEAELEAATMRLAAGTRIREVRFDRREQFAELLGYVPYFARAVPGSTRLAAEALLRPVPASSGFELCCPREYEAQILDYATAWAIVVDWREIKCPTKVVGSDPTLRSSFLPTLDFAEILQVEYDFVPDASHFVQIERPQTCLAMLKEFLRTQKMLVS